VNRLRRLAGSVFLALAVAGLTGGVHGVRAAEEESYSVRARADTAGVQVITPEAPAVSLGGGELAFITPSTAQSELDSLGSSRAFASAPYPGDLIVGLPGTVAGLAGGPPLPGYPLFVASSHPVQPSATVENGPYALAAKSAADSSDATARVGVSVDPPQVASGISRSSVTRDGAGVLVAEASASIAALAVAPDVRVGEIFSTARVVFDPAHPERPPVKTSSLSIGRIVAAGVEIGLTRDGLVAAGQTLVPGDLSAAEQALAAAGVTLEYFPGSETPTSITSASVQITTQQNLPNLGNSTVRWVLGLVSASADGVAGALAAELPLTAPEIPDDLEPSFTPTEGAGVAAALGGRQTAPARTGTGENAPPLAVVPASRSVGPDLAPLFAILAAGAGLALGSSRLTKWLAVRERLGAGVG
jgi:hypothetical protein